MKQKHADSIRRAVMAQANDASLWIQMPSIGEAYIQQSLRWLHSVIEENDDRAMASILEQAEDHTDKGDGVGD